MDFSINAVVVDADRKQPSNLPAVPILVPPSLLASGTPPRVPLSPSALPLRPHALPATVPVHARELPPVRAQTAMVRVIVVLRRARLSSHNPVVPAVVLALLSMTPAPNAVVLELLPGLVRLKYVYRQVLKMVRRFVLKGKVKLDCAVPVSYTHLRAHET